jgi:anti-anti-sigma regulatory factor
VAALTLRGSNDILSLVLNPDMGAVPTKLWVALAEGEALVKVSGRATFACGADLKRLLNELCERGWKHFTFDLSECPLMDSTFLGIMAGFGMKLNAAGVRRAVLLGSSPKIVELLDNLGVAHLFDSRPGPPPPVACQLVQPPGQPASKAETTQAALEAHQILMALNPANVTKFKDVARFLAEDLKRLESPSGSEGGSR